MALSFDLTQWLSAILLLTLSGVEGCRLLGDGDRATELASAGTPPAIGGGPGCGRGLTNPSVRAPSDSLTDELGDVCSRTTNHVSGSRLKARLLVTSEGDRAWLGWHDTELDEDCTFTELVDGSYACLPDGASVGDSSSLSDDRLEHPGVAFSADDSSPGVPTHPETSRRAPATRGDDYCATSRTTAAQLGEELREDAPVFSRDSASGKSSLLGGADSSFRLFAAEPTNQDRYVHAERKVVKVGRVGAVVLAASDGTVQNLSWYDAELESACIPGTTYDRRVRCLPEPSQDFWTSALVDACCEGSFRIASCGNDATYAREFSRGSCSAHSEVRPLGAGPLPDAPYCDSGTRSCAESLQEFSDWHPDARVLDPTNEIPAARLEELKQCRDTRDPGRLEPWYYTTSEGLCLFLGWWDVELDQPCEFRPVAPGDWRCLPYPVAPEQRPFPSREWTVPSEFLVGGPEQRFTDNVCSQPVNVLEVSACAAGNVAPKFGIVAGGGDPGGPYDLVFRRLDETVDVTYRAYDPQWEESACSEGDWGPYQKYAGPIDTAIFMGGQVIVE